MKRFTALLVCTAILFSLLGTLPVAAEQGTVSIFLNGTQLSLSTAPVVQNSIVMVPAGAVSEAMGATVNFYAPNETLVIATATDKRITITNGSCIATIDGKPEKLQETAYLKDGEIFVPFNFISENLDCKATFDEQNATISISSNEITSEDIICFYGSAHFALGGWVAEGNYAMRGKSNTAAGSDPIVNTKDDAILKFNIYAPGKYKVWVSSKDFPNNLPGYRYFRVAVDGVRSDVIFGTHGQNGYLWQEAGTYDFTKGEHTINLQDTSAYYARCGGVIITGDLDFIPPTKEAEYAVYSADDGTKSQLIPAQYPVWATENMQDSDIETIENDKLKMVFYQGNGEKGALVQNEIYLKKDNEWILVKERNEELGVLAMRSLDAPYNTSSPSGDLTELPKNVFNTTYEGFDKTISFDAAKDFYKIGKPEWLIPSSMKKIGDSVVLTMSSDNVDATLTFTFDDLCAEPKATFKATVKKDGGYSFAFFTGNEFEDGSFSRVTAPLSFVKDFVPEDSFVLSEYMMFTPMVTFTFGEGENAFTKGVVVDPSYVRRNVAGPGDSAFGVMFRSPNGLVRGQIVAPVLNDIGSEFKAGDSYDFAYRIVYNHADWYENYVHVAEDMYNCVDLRTNYYHSVNEAIYNVTDLVLDDVYGGWDDKDMGFYNMEADQYVTQSNIIEFAQRYALTENEQILEERLIPSVAYALSRGNVHFKSVEGEAVYSDVTPVPLTGPIKTNSPAAYIGMYQFSRGRTPYLLNLGLNCLAGATDLRGVSGYNAMNEMFPDDRYVNALKQTADNYIENYLGDDESAFNNKPFVEGFVSSDSNNMLNAFIQAYEATGDQKYLDAATEAARYSILTLWTTGYQNDYAETTYKVDPVKTAERMEVNGNARWFFHKDGVQWRVGNPYGVVTTAAKSQSKLKEEFAPGWVPARAGMSTEHLRTPANYNAITMNMWAGTMLKMARYTGDEFFLTQARNAIIGKFGNYGGYYWDRYLLHDKQENYPYEGPDFNMIYWHHIPVFLGMLEDFLINEVWLRSDANIEFPSVVNSGYAYFTTNQYGFESGKFYDEDGMWLWLDKGVLEPDSIEVSYVTARKKDTLGVALVNENENALTTTITLGEKIPNSATHTEIATLYDKDGNKSTVEIVNGKFTVTIPARSIVSVVLHPDVDVPAFAREYVVSNSLGDTAKAFNGGKAYLLQFNDDNYYAYIYTDKMPKDTKSVTFDYKIGDKTESITVSEYPFETIIKVSADKDIAFKVTENGLDGSRSVLAESFLSPLTEDEITPYRYGDYTEEEFVSLLPKFDDFDISVSSIGADSNQFRLVVPTKELLAGMGVDSLESNEIKGTKVKAVLRKKSGNDTLMLESVISSCEIRTNGTTVLGVMPTDRVPLSIYSDIETNTTAKILHPTKKFEDYKILVDNPNYLEKPVELSYNSTGAGGGYAGYAGETVSFVLKNGEEVSNALGIKLEKGLNISVYNAQNNFDGLVVNGDVTYSGVAAVQNKDGSFVYEADGTTLKTEEFSYTYKLVDAPVIGFRTNSTGEALVVEINDTDYYDTTGKNKIGVTRRLSAPGIKIFSEKLSNAVLTNKSQVLGAYYDTGKFPKGTIFISVTEFINDTDSLWNGVLSNSVSITNNEYAYKVWDENNVCATKGVGPSVEYKSQVEGTYDVWVMRADLDKTNSTTRGAKFYIGDNLYISTERPNDFAGTNAKDRYFFWSKPNGATVTLEKNQKFKVQYAQQADTYCRLAMIALVPTNATIELPLTSTDIYSGPTAISQDTAVALRTLYLEKVEKMEISKEPVCAMVNGKEYSVVATAISTDIFGDDFATPSVYDAILAAGLTAKADGKTAEYITLNGKEIVNAHKIPLQENDVITVSDATVDAFSPVSVSSLFAACGSANNSGTPLKFCMNLNAIHNAKLKFALTYGENGSYVENETEGTGILGAYLSGYLTLSEAYTVNGLTVPPKTKQLLTHPAHHEILGYDAKSNGRLDVFVNNLTYKDKENVMVSSNESGVAIWRPYHMSSNPALDKTNLYLVDKNTSFEVEVLKKDDKFALMSDGAISGTLFVVNYTKDNEFVGIEKKEEIVITPLTPYVGTVTENQKIFIWNSTPYSSADVPFGTNLFPLCAPVTK